MNIIDFAIRSFSMSLGNQFIWSRLIRIMWIYVDLCGST